MGSMGEEDMNKKRATWVYPRAAGFIPSERWGHSACCSNGVLYVFGGCCGGVHFGDVLALDLNTMTWSPIPTTGDQPGPRDSHTAALVNDQIFVFGGTNGTQKVNAFHVLDLKTMKWARPTCRGAAPPPRESHSATVFGGEGGGERKLVVFGGSGGGERKYLNDVHVLDLERMVWSSPEVKGEKPVARDSHAAFAIGKRLFVYGGDCGDRYLGGVDVLDLDTFTWSKLEVKGPSPGVRAGHSIVNVGSKVYVIGGVGDKRYYGDVWVLHVEDARWCQLDVRGKLPQGRFSHTATGDGSEVVIYGGCGEDERPLNELIILQLDSNCGDGAAACHVTAANWPHERRRFTRRPPPLVPPPSLSLLTTRSTRPLLKRRKTVAESTPKQEEFSPLQWDQELSKSTHPEFPRLIGAEVHGTVDGVFDSGFLMTAKVNGQIFRGVLFAPVSRVYSPTVGMAAPPSPAAARLRAPQGSPESSRRSVQLAKNCPPRSGGDFGGLVLSLGSSVGGS